ncbi:MAG TPA: ABC transporter ATP-binding protein, partial [Methylophaga sp.]|nr:ABC transporter ATP-binding protein [Methylophaga sp.]
PAAKLEPASAAKSVKKKSTLTYQQQLDLKALPLEIERLEQQIAALTEKMAAADFYQQDANKIKQVQTQMAELEKSLEAAFDKWAELEALQNA